jgi:hypothetical protein
MNVFKHSDAVQRVGSGWRQHRHKVYAGGLGWAAESPAHWDLLNTMQVRHYGVRLNTDTGWVYVGEGGLKEKRGTLVCVFS